MGKRSGADLVLLKAELSNALGERSFARELVDAAFGEGRWSDLDERVQFEALKLGMAYQYGKPKETVELQAPGDPLLDEVSDEELRQMRDNLTRKAAIEATATRDELPDNVRALPERKP